MKSTMSARNISKFHKLLANDVSVDKISKFLGVTKATLKKFSPEIMAKVSVSKKAAADKVAGKAPAGAGTEGGSAAKPAAAADKKG